MATQDIVFESIWGGPRNDAIYVLAYDHEHNVLFRLTADPAQGEEHILNRILTCYFDIETDNALATFADLDDAREAIFSLARSVGASCSQCPELSQPNVLIALSADETGSAEWSVYHNPLYSTYYKDLIKKTVDFSTLRRSTYLGGHGSTTKVHCVESDDIFVFKGVDLASYSGSWGGEDDDGACLVFECWAKELNALYRLPPHPNIPPLPSTFVTIPPPRGAIIGRDEPVVCGCLSPFVAGGDLRCLMLAGTTVPLRRKARWCYQMTSVIKHAHDHGEYHKNIKPANMLINDKHNILVIDWEQTLSPTTTIAPEADGTWDLKIPGNESPKPSGKPTLKYNKVIDPTRRNQPLGSGPLEWDIWNVFPIWQKECPLALELAEVFSLGRTMWMLLEGHSLDSEDYDHPDELVTEWSEESNVPVEWEEMLDKCMSEDPNARPGLADLTEFWRSEMERCWDESGIVAEHVRQAMT